MLRILRYLLLAFTASASALAHAQLLTTDPVHPVANEAFQLTITAPMSGSETGAPEAILQGGAELHVYLHQECLFLCPPPATRSRTIAIGPLPAGVYTVYVHEGPRVTNPPVISQGVVMVSETYLDIATDPATPPAYVPFALRATLALRVPITTSPRLEINGSDIVWHLNGDCPFLCGGPTRTTLSIAMPPLAPGEYNVTVIPGAPGVNWAPTRSARLTVAGGENYQGLWWRSPAGLESGWGVNIAHQAETLFATWFTYDENGDDMWLVTPSAAFVGRGVYEGALYRATGLPGGSAAVNLTPSSSLLAVGTARFTFTDASNGEFAYVVNGVAKTKPITRQVFAARPHTCVTGGALPATSSYQDLWWNAPAGSEAGWGVNVTHQGDILFATVFGYDTAGRGTWMVMPDARRDAVGNYSGALYQARGPSYAAEWRQQDVQVTRVGDGTLTFTGHDAGIFAYRLAGAGEVRKTITRQRFAAPETACN